jgi:FkbM family methyltransferase
MYKPDWLRHAKRMCLGALGVDHLLTGDVLLRTAHVGSRYGGWRIALDPLIGVEKPIVFSFGLGDDISFDTEMAGRFGAKVYGFDPSPMSLKFIDVNGKPDSMEVFPIGLSDVDGSQVFTAAATDKRGNFSVKANREVTVIGNVMRYDSIVAMLDVRCPDVLKLDIEGSEYEVLPDILSRPDLPKQIVIEFHHRVHGIKVEETLRSVAALRAGGYRIFSISPSGHEFGFIHAGADNLRLAS